MTNFEKKIINKIVNMNEKLVENHEQQTNLRKINDRSIVFLFNIKNMRVIYMCFNKNVNLKKWSEHYDY